MGRVATVREPLQVAEGAYFPLTVGESDRFASKRRELALDCLGRIGRTREARRQGYRAQRRAV